jgi:ribosomal-protein-alanine N-acetyltransferase
MIPSMHTAAPLVWSAGPEDAAVMAGIHASSFAPGWNDDAIGELLALPGSLSLLAATRSDEAAQGLLIARAAADEAELLTLCVLPAFRRHGLGRALLTGATAALRAGGIKHLFLEVDPDNAAAVELYRSLGGNAVGHRSRYYEHGADAAIFSLAL